MSEGPSRWEAFRAFLLKNIMSLTDIMRLDLQAITSNGSDFGVAVDFVAPDGSTATVNCLVTTHHNSFDENGEAIDSRQSSVAVSEPLLTDEYYPVRNGDNDVNLTGHLISFLESTGEKKTYIAEQWFPDESIGLIVIMLGEYNA